VTYEHPHADRTEGFLKLTASAVDQMAATPLSAAAWRVLVFLMRELLHRAGRGNGQLKAPHRQLVAFGVSASLVSRAITELEVAGLVRCHRQGKRIASLFELTWLPLSERRVRERRTATMNGGRVAM
jgi:DNA-binding transcriptional ArsR family regulator